MNKQDRMKYLMGLGEDELRLLAEDKMASDEMREGAQSLLRAQYEEGPAGDSTPEG